VSAMSSAIHLVSKATVAIFGGIFSPGHFVRTPPNVAPLLIGCVTKQITNVPCKIQVELFLECSIIPTFCCVHVRTHSASNYIAMSDQRLITDSAYCRYAATSKKNRPFHRKSNAAAKTSGRKSIRRDKRSVM